MLRQYQLDLIEKAKKHFLKGHKSIILQLPTGGGKTKLTSAMIKGSLNKNKKSLFIVHRRELVEQSAQAFKQDDIPFGVIASGFKVDLDKPVQIASIQTLKNKLHLLKHKFDLVVFDECHHIAAKNWASIHTYFFDSYKIGLTATPCRLDGKGLKDYFSHIIEGPTMRELITQKYLCDYKAFAPTQIDLTQVKTTLGDYNKSELYNLMDQQKFTGDAVREYKSKLVNKRAVVFCVNIEHSKHVAQEFNLNGIKAAHIDGTDDNSFRSETLESFRNGDIKVLCNVDLFGEGFDLPAIEAVILLRPTKSLSLYLQQVGRSLRPSENKTEAIILDHVRNIETHGLPCDEREWSLEGIKSNKKQSSEVGVKICPECMAALKSVARYCNYCGHTFVVNTKEFNILDASTKEDLKEINKDNFKIKKIDVEKARAVTKDDLIRIGISRGYKRPHFWAHQVMQARQRKKLKSL